MHDGQPQAGKIRSAREGFLVDAGLGAEVVRHLLRRTAATWLMQKGTDRWHAAGWLRMMFEQLENATIITVRTFGKKRRRRLRDVDKKNKAALAGGHHG